MRLVLQYISNALQLLIWLMMGVLALASVIGFTAVMSVVWAINPLAGLGLLAFGLAVVAFMFYF